MVATIQKQKERILALEKALMPFARMYREGNTEEDVILCVGTGCDADYLFGADFKEAFLTLYD